MRRLPILLLSVALLALPLTGCIGKDEEPIEKSDEQKKAEEILGEQGEQKLLDVAAVVPKNYTFPKQKLLPPIVLDLGGVVGTDVNGGYEGERDESGVDYNNPIQWHDISQHLPAGQPAEIVLRVFWDASEANSADLDLAVDVPGTRTTYSAVSESFNWNYVVKAMVVNTVGVEGMPARVGVQVSSGVVSQGFDYKLEVAVTYVKDVLTPHHAWALDVPPGASGLILESEKAGGDEHITSEFILVGPDDNLVKYVDFNDIDIPTQSVFIPTPSPGTYVFYAQSMHGGFLRVKADVPLVNLEARPLALVETRVVDSNAPAPGLAGKDVGNNSAAAGVVPSDDVNPTVVQFSPEGAFPLRVTPFIEGQVVSMAKITLKSPAGLVAQRTVIGQYSDERGTIGYTSDHEGGPNHVHQWRNLQKGSWTAEIVNDNPGVEIGHVVLSYQR